MVNQRGNILFLILLAVVLFAALSYAVTQSTRGGGNNANDEKMQSKAAELLNYFAQIDTATQRMMLTHGVKDYELNFYYLSASRFVIGNFDNTNCTDSRCRVFDPAGGAVAGRKLDGFARDPSTGVTILPRIAYQIIPGAGSSKPDIVMWVQAIPWALCDEINKRSGLGSTLFNVSETGTLMYQSAIPTGPISDSMPTVNVPFSVGNKGTFCASPYADQATAEASGLGLYYPILYHVVVAR